MFVSRIATLGAIAGFCGFAAGTVAAAGDEAGVAAKRVLTVDECVAAHYKPKKIEGVCGGRGGYGPYVRGIKWSSYGARQGAGTGRLSVGIVAGDPNYYPGTIRVFRPRPCKRAGRPIFTRLAWRYTGKKPRGAATRGKHSFYCSDLTKR